MSGRARWIADWVVRLVLPLAVAGTVIAVFLGEQMSIEHELALTVPRRAVRGETLPIRAIVITDLSSLEGPRLVPTRVAVTLRDASGRTLATSRLEPTPAGAEGALPIPHDAPRHVTLRAVAEVEGRGVATATVAYDLDEPPVAEQLVGRAAYDTQHHRQGPIEPIDGHTPPSSLTTRVVGGLCVPEAPCEVLVHVGAPAARVRFAPSAAISVVQTPGRATEALARIVVTVHGPEAHPTLEAVRDGVVVARRELTLPVALATPSLRVVERLLPRDAVPRIEVRVLGDRPLIVDAYREGRWRYTGSVRATEEAIDAPVPGLAPGVWRLQARTDPASVDRAASILVAVGLDLEGALARLSAMGGDTEPPPPGDEALRFAWAAATLEVGHRALPPEVRGIEQDRAALAERQRTLRIVALVAMAFGLVVVVVVVLRRGLDAAAEAQRVMDATGDPELRSPAHRRRTLLSALAIVATVILAFLAAGAMIVARAGLLE